jgi:type IV pilus assembly protein PilM
MSNIVGLDLGVGMIKAISLSKVNNGFTLDALGEIKGPNVDWVRGENKISGTKEMGAAIKKLLVDLKVKARQAVACIPEDEVVSRLVNLPPLKDSEIMDALKFEAETFVPYPLNQVTIDYEIVEKDDNGRLKIFVVAAKNDLITSFVNLFKSIGLELVALESPAIAMRRVIKSSVKADVTGIIALDYGEKYSDIIGLSNGNICFTRSMPIGGESITRAISINLGLDMPSAEEYKKAYGMQESQLEGKIRAAVMPIFMNMAEEIRKTMSLFLEGQGRAIELLVLSGGGANMPGLAEELTKVLGVEVQVVQPFLNIDTSKLSLPINLATEGCRFSYAVGLALRGLVE